MVENNAESSDINSLLDLDLDYAMDDELKDDEKLESESENHDNGTNNNAPNENGGDHEKDEPESKRSVRPKRRTPTKKTTAKAKPKASLAKNAKSKAPSPVRKTAPKAKVTRSSTCSKIVEEVKAANVDLKKKETNNESPPSDKDKSSQLPIKSEEAAKPEDEKSKEEPLKIYISGIPDNTKIADLKEFFAGLPVQFKLIKFKSMPDKLFGQLQLSDRSLFSKIVEDYNNKTFKEQTITLSDQQPGKVNNPSANVKGNDKQKSESTPNGEAEKAKSSSATNKNSASDENKHKSSVAQNKKSSSQNVTDKSKSTGTSSKSTEKSKESVKPNEAAKSKESSKLKEPIKAKEVAKPKEISTKEIKKSKETLNVKEGEKDKKFSSNLKLKPKEANKNSLPLKSSRDDDHPHSKPNYRPPIRLDHRRLEQARENREVQRLRTQNRRDDLELEKIRKERAKYAKEKEMLELDVERKRIAILKIQKEELARQQALLAQSLYMPQSGMVHMPEQRDVRGVKRPQTDSFPVNKRKFDSRKSPPPTRRSPVREPQRHRGRRSSSPSPLQTGGKRVFQTGSSRFESRDTGFKKNNKNVDFTRKREKSRDRSNGRDERERKNVPFRGGHRVVGDRHSRSPIRRFDAPRDRFADKAPGGPSGVGGGNRNRESPRHHHHNSPPTRGSNFITSRSYVSTPGSAIGDSRNNSSWMESSGAGLNSSTPASSSWNATTNGRWSTSFDNSTSNLLNNSMGNTGGAMNPIYNASGYQHLPPIPANPTGQFIHTNSNTRRY